jgi:hypothetical protein
VEELTGLLLEGHASKKVFHTVIDAERSVLVGQHCLVGLDGSHLHQRSVRCFANTWETCGCRDERSSCKKRDDES